MDKNQTLFCVLLSLGREMVTMFGGICKALVSLLTMYSSYLSPKARSSRMLLPWQLPWAFPRIEKLCFSGSMLSFSFQFQFVLNV